jgi:hypothetical protein
MVKAICKTNLDEFKQEVWPEEFVAVPNIGDWVQAKSGRVLHVVKIMHTIMYAHSLEGDDRSYPYIEVELSKKTSI